MEQSEQDEFIVNACRQFVASINASAASRLRGEDGYEVLSLVFGESFTPADLCGATAEQQRDLAMAVWELLECRVSPEAISAALANALPPD